MSLNLDEIEAYYVRLEGELKNNKQPREHLSVILELGDRARTDLPALVAWAREAEGMLRRIEEDPFIAYGDDGVRREIEMLLSRLEDTQ